MDDERGATIVEFALVGLLFFSLLFVVVELGLAFRAKLIVDDGVQSAARVGAAVGNGLDVDLNILNELISDVQSLPNNGVGVISHVEVYKVNSNGTPNLSELNRYFYTWTADPTDCDWTPCPEGSAGYNGWTWRPDERGVAVGALDEIGVKVYFAHNFITGFLPSDSPTCDTPAGNPANCWTEDTILRLEPLQFSTGT
jgi:hypothetical protein